MSPAARLPSYVEMHLPKKRSIDITSFVRKRTIKQRKQQQNAHSMHILAYDMHPPRDQVAPSMTSKVQEHLDLSIQLDDEVQREETGPLNNNGSLSTRFESSEAFSLSPAQCERGNRLPKRLIRPCVSRRKIFGHS